MLIRDKLERTVFPPSEQVIVEYLLKEQLNIEPKSTSQIAKETFSSKSTIVKMAKRLKFSGWREFKTAYLEELRYLARQQATVDANYPFHEHDHYMAIAQKLARLEQEAIEETLSLLQYQTLQQVVQLLSQAPAIHVFAVSNNLLITQEFRYNMERIKKRVYVHAVQGEGMYAATLMEPQECALVISYSGETESLLTNIKILKKRGIPIILITSVGDNSMVRLANHVLRISTRERLYSKIATFANDSAITYLLDVLYGCVFQQKYQANADLRRQTSQIFELRRQSEVEWLKE